MQNIALDRTQQELEELRTEESRIQQQRQMQQQQTAQETPLAEEEQAKELKERVEGGESKTQVAEYFGLTRQGLYNYLKR